MRIRIELLACALSGCGSVGSKQIDANMPVDSSQPDTGLPDAAAICDPPSKFDAPIPLVGFNTTKFEGVPRLSPDELDLYYGGGDANAVDLFRAQRSRVSDAFGAPASLSGVNSAANEYNPTVSSDGFTLFFESDRVSGEAGHLYVSTRSARVGEFGSASLVANVNSASRSDIDAQPFLTMDGQELWFTSTREGGAAGRDIFRATWNGSAFATPARVPALSGGTDDYLPTLSADRLTVYFSSARSGGKGNFDIWTSHRTTTLDGFPEPKPVSELNTSANDYVGWVSPDNCRIYLSSDTAGTRDIYIASRPPG